MAERKAAEDDFDPRHRIVGAVVLVALAVIFLPMFLSSQPPENAPPLTDRPGAETRVVTTPVPPFAESPAQTSPVAEKPAEQGAPARTSTRVVPVAEPVAEKPTDSSPAPAPPVNDGSENKPPKNTKTPAKTNTSPAKGWTVQVGLFSHVENVRRLQEKLKHKGYSVIIDPPVPVSGKPTRVEVGPYKDAAAAKAAQARLHDDLSIDGVVRKP